MPESISMPPCTDEQTKLFENAGKNDQDAILKLTAILTDEQLASSEDWPDETIKFWADGMEDFALANTGAKLCDDAAALTRAMLNAALDSAALRGLYETLAKQQFADYEDKDGLVEALGLNHEDVKLNHIAQKWAVLEETKKHVFCYGRSLGVNEVLDINDACNDVKLRGLKKCTISLRSFLENAIVVKYESEVTPWLTKKVHPPKMPAADLEALVKSCVVTATTLPMNLTRALLVPRILTDTTLKNLTSVSSKKNATEAETSSRWDKSRDIKELYERLKASSSFECPEDVDLENVGKHLLDAAEKPEHASVFAYSLATLQEHQEHFADWLQDIIAQLKDIAIVWSNTELFSETSDKIPGKQVFAWFQATQEAMGSEYLVQRTFNLPFKLWSHTEKVLDKTGEEALLHDMVEEKLNDGKVAADLLYWVYKSKYDDLKAHLTDSTLLFKTLLKEVRGSYLKAQRDLKKLLLSDKPFQCLIMNNGEENAVSGLVRSIKTLTLLDNSEKQSLLVQIVRIYPEYIHLVEDKKAASKRSALPRITSIRSMKRRQLELDDIVNRQIPENRNAIEVARGYGDLRENSEFKFAKERQRFLNNRRAEYEQSLTNLRATDFRGVEISNQVVPGCTVVLNQGTGHDEEFHILGLLDTLPEQNIISFETPLGKTLIGHKTADHVELPNGKKAIIKEIKKLSPELLDWLSSDPDPVIDQH